jgi:chorismate dehydratase
VKAHQVVLLEVIQVEVEAVEAVVVVGKIDYLNLLPFHIFIKKYNIKTKEGYPSQVNRLFDKKLVEAGFISSIKSKNKKCFNAGIIANKKVMSVLVCEGQTKDDFESNTSNALAKILNLQGEIVIGDKALQRYFKNSKKCKDLAEEWYKKYNLPFVFARFCVNKNYKQYEKLINKFLKTKVKIPQYILKQRAKKLGLTTKEVREYLDLIYYKMGHKEKRSLKIFLKTLL